MDQEEQKFMSTECVYYDNTGLKIKEDAPELVKKEYDEFMNESKKYELD